MSCVYHLYQIPGTHFGFLSGAQHLFSRFRIDSHAKLQAFSRTNAQGSGKPPPDDFSCIICHVSQVEQMSRGSRKTTRRLLLDVDVFLACSPYLLLEMKTIQIYRHMAHRDEDLSLQGVAGFVGVTHRRSRAVAVQLRVIVVQNNI